MSDTEQESNPIYILHIEDEQGVRNMFERMARRVFGAVVVGVESGEEAIKVLGDHSWAAVMSDWNIKGGQTGGDVYYMMREEYPQVASRYVFMSDSQHAAQLCEEEGLQFVEKPANQAKICDALAKTMGKPT